MPAMLRVEGLRDPCDGELCRDIAGGDMRAFERLMRRHNRTLFRTARAILRDDAEAEEAVQDAYLRAHASIDSFRGQSRVSTWLVRIVANEALARRRKFVRRARIVPLYEPDSGGLDAEPSVTAGEEPLERAARDEMRRLLEAKIDGLPDAYRAVFVLRALEELTVEETSAALGIPPATVRTRFFRARGHLREALARETDFVIGDAFAFAGERCDRIVRRVLHRLVESQQRR